MTASGAPDTDAGLPATAFVGMRVIDGTGAAPRDDMVVVVRGAHIGALGHRSDIDVPNGASVIDATGQVLMPGLVDLHCHYGGGRDGLANAFGVQLRFGVTTVRSLGADGANHLAFIAEAESGAFPAPRIYTAGIGFSTPGGLPPGLPGMHRPTSEAQAREMVRGHGRTRRGPGEDLGGPHPRRIARHGVAPPDRARDTRRHRRRGAQARATGCRAHLRGSGRPPARRSGVSGISFTPSGRKTWIHRSCSWPATTT